MTILSDLLFYLSIPIFLYLIYDFIRYIKINKSKKGLSTRLLLRGLLLISLVAIPLFVVREFGSADSGFFSIFLHVDSWHYWSIGSASVLMLIWFLFLRKMDFFETEKIHHLVIIFIISIGSMYLLYPLNYLLHEGIGFSVPNNGYGEFLYCVVSIGLLEEIVKIIPVLLFLKFSKAINEPFDYILYGSVSALGFSYIENVQYFDMGLHNIAIRGIFCCIGHMALTSIVAYGLMLAKYRGYNKYLLFGGFLLIAAILHGIYDFVLMSYFVRDFVFVSSIIVIFLIHLWIYFMNNTLNMSPFYSDKMKFNSRNLQFLGLVVCIVVLMTGYVAIGFNQSIRQAEYYLTTKLYALSFFIALFLYSIRNMTLIKGYLGTLSFPFKNKGIKIKRSDNSGRTINLLPSDNYSVDTDILQKKDLFQEAVIASRWIVDERLNSYLVRLSKPINSEKYVEDQILLIPVWDEKELSEKRKIIVRIYLIPHNQKIGQSFTETKNYQLVGKVYSQLVPNLQTEIALG